MFTSGVGDGVTFDGRTIKYDLAYAMLLALWVLDGDGVFCIAELTLNSVFLGCRGQTGVYLQTAILRFNTQNILRNGEPHPGSSTREP